MQRLGDLNSLRITDNIMIVDFLDSKKKTLINTKLPLSLNDSLNLRQFYFRPSFYCSSKKFKDIYNILIKYGLKPSSYQNADIIFNTHKSYDQNSQYVARLPNQSLFTNQLKLNKMVSKSLKIMEIDEEKLQSNQQANKKENAKEETTDFDPFAIVTTENSSVNVVSHNQESDNNNFFETEWGDFQSQSEIHNNPDNNTSDQQITSHQLEKQQQNNEQDLTQHTVNKNVRTEQQKCTEITYKILVIYQKAIRYYVCSEEFNEQVENVCKIYQLENQNLHDIVKNQISSSLQALMLTYLIIHNPAYAKSQSCDNNVDNEQIEKINQESEREQHIKQIKQKFSHQTTFFQAFQCVQKVYMDHTNDQLQNKLKIDFVQFKTLFDKQDTEFTNQNEKYQWENYIRCCLQVIGIPIHKGTLEIEYKHKNNTIMKQQMLLNNEETTEKKNKIEQIPHFRSFYRSELRKVLQNDKNKLEYQELWRNLSIDDQQLISNFTVSSISAKNSNFEEISGNVVIKNVLQRLPYDQLLYFAVCEP